MYEVYGRDSYLITDDECYEIGILDMENTNPSKTTAYLHDDFYYVYRGEMTKYELERTPGLKPGIYKITDTNTMMRVDPSTADEMNKYTYKDKIGSVKVNDIVSKVNANKEILIHVPEYTKVSFQNIDKNDDLLKRIIKTAFNRKGIGVDDCESGFADKNARFNFKQAVNGPNRLSIMYFERGCEALNLGYEIRLFEKNPSSTVGAPLTEPIEMSTEDTYDL